MGVGLLSSHILACLTHTLLHSESLGEFSGESKVWKYTKNELCQLSLGGRSKEALGLFLCSREHGGGHFLNPGLKLIALQKWQRNLILQVKILRTKMCTHLDAAA